MTGRPDSSRTRTRKYTNPPSGRPSRAASESVAGRRSRETTHPVGTSPIARAQRENDSSSPNDCTRGPPMTTRRAPRRDAITPSARSAANACRTVPRDTEYRSASSDSDGRVAPGG